MGFQGYTGAQTLRLNAVRGKTIKLNVSLSDDNTNENGFCYWDSTDENKLQTITVTIPESFNVGDYITRKAVFNDGGTGTGNFTVTVYIQAIDAPM